MRQVTWLASLVDLGGRHLGPRPPKAKMALFATPPPKKKTQSLLVLEAVTPKARPHIPVFALGGEVSFLIPAPLKKGQQQTSQVFSKKSQRKSSFGTGWRPLGNNVRPLGVVPLDDFLNTPLWSADHIFSKRPPPKPSAVSASGVRHIRLLLIGGSSWLRSRHIH